MVQRRPSPVIPAHDVMYFFAVKHVCSRLLLAVGVTGTIFQDAAAAPAAAACGLGLCLSRTTPSTSISQRPAKPPLTSPPARGSVHSSDGMCAVSRVFLRICFHRLRVCVFAAKTG